MEDADALSDENARYIEVNEKISRQTNKRSDIHVVY